MNTAADSCTAMKKWLATIPYGKLPTSQKIRRRIKIIGRPVSSDASIISCFTETLADVTGHI
jgi:hypothetical protein